MVVPYFVLEIKRDKKMQGRDSSRGKKPTQNREKANTDKLNK